MLEVQTVAFQINSLCWRYKQLLYTQFLDWRYKQLISKATPMLPVGLQIVAFQINPNAGGTSLRWRYRCRRPVLATTQVACCRYFFKEVA